jgi:hypothetical protein
LSPEKWKTLDRIASALERIANALEPERLDEHELNLYDRISNIEFILERYTDSKTKL